jgi:hypothetical protein
MLRILVVWILSALLAGCSGSSKLEEIVPDWANAPPRRDASASLAAEPRAAPAAESRGTPAAEPQEAKKTEGQSPSEE